MTKQQQKLMTLAMKGGSDADLVLLDTIHELEGKVDTLEKKLADEMAKEIKFPEMKFPKVQKVQIEGAKMFTIKGEKGDKGDKGDKGEKGEVGEKGTDGKDGVDGRNGLDGQNGIDGMNGLDGKNGLDGQAGNDGSPDTPEQVRDKLETLKGDERLDAKFIKGLQEEIETLKTAIARIPRGKIGGSRGKIPIIRVEDLTSQVNGVVTTFTLPRDTTRVYAVWSTQFPITFSSSDFSLAGNTLSLGSGIGTIQSGQTLMAMIETLFYA